MSQDLLELQGISAWYGASQVLWDIDLRVRQGSVTALLGANGAGKTSLLRALSGLIRRRGMVRWDGTDVSRLPTAGIVRLGIAQVPEGRGTFTDLSVRENLLLGAHVRRDKAGIQADLQAMLAQFPRLGERQMQPAGTLSGGEQQMLAIARALMLRPRLLLLDEPSFGLAPLVVREIFATLARIRDECGLTMLVVEQNSVAALGLADEGYVLAAGRVVAGGTGDELRDSEAVRRAYFGT
jgi:branched-chain amino acid transport system ATP-binding protein